MAIKMRALYYSKKPKMKTFAELITAENQCKAADVIPPAYPCENEKLVIMGLSLGKELPDNLRQFCDLTNKQRAQNVALYVDGSKETAALVIERLRAAGTNVIDDVFYCDGGLPIAFLAKVSDKEKTDILAWSNKIVASLS